MGGTGYLSDDGFFDDEGGGLGGTQIGEGIFEEGFNLVGRDAAIASDFKRRGGQVVGADEAGGAGVVAIGVNDGEGCAIAGDLLAGIAGAGEELSGLGLVEMQGELLSEVTMDWT